jgi:RNA polymerase sigma-70 factor, ECF subfamily
MVTPSRLESLPREDPASDEDLVRRILGGERPLFAVLMRRYNQRVFRAVRAILREDHEAEDVAQHAWVAAYFALQNFRGEARFSTWLTRIAVNEALSRLRKAARSELALVDSGGLVMEQPSPEDSTYRSEVGSILEEHIDDLPESLRVVFVLREVEELSTAETAASLEISEEAVRVRLHRARNQLQERLSRVLEASREAFRFELDRCDRIVLSVMDRLLQP